MRRKRAVRSVWMLVACLIAAMPAWAEPLRSAGEVQALVQGLLVGRTPPLEAGTVREVGQSYEVEVVTPGSSLVDRWLVDKASGRIRSLYGRMLLSFQPGGGVMVPGSTIAQSQTPGQTPTRSTQPQAVGGDSSRTDGLP